jgi:hypothetical protein
VVSFKTHSLYLREKNMKFTLNGRLDGLLSPPLELWRREKYLTFVRESNQPVA